MSPHDMTPDAKGFRNKRNTPFTMLANAMLRNKGLSLKAKGLLAVMLSFPDDWQYHMSHIETLSTDGRDGHRAAIKELENAGYIARQQVRGEGGKMSNSVFIVSDSILTVDGFSGDGFSGDGKTPTTNTDSTKTDHTKKLKDGTQKTACTPEPSELDDLNGKNTPSPFLEAHQTAGKGTGLTKATSVEDVPGAAVVIPGPLLAREGFAAAWAEWLSYRRARRLSCLPVTLHKQLAMLAAQPDPVGVIEYSLTNGYQGLFPEKHRKGKPQTPQEANDRALETAKSVYRAITEDADNVPF